MVVRLVILFFALLVGFVIFAVHKGSQIQKQREAEWRRFAEENGLQFRMEEITSGVRHPRVEGTLDGRPFSIYAEWVYHEDSHSSCPRVRLLVEDAPEGFLMYPRPDGAVARRMEAWSAELGKRIGVRVGDPVETGDEAFDRDWIVRAHDPGAARMWLTPARREALVEFLGAANYEVDPGGELLWSTYGAAPVTRDELEPIVARFRACAAGL